VVAATYFDAEKYDVHQYMEAEGDSTGSFSHLKVLFVKKYRPT